MTHIKQTIQNILGLITHRSRARQHIDSWLEADGLCTACHEHTSPIAPCCGTSVAFEGDFENWEDLMDEFCTCDGAETCYACKYLNER